MKQKIRELEESKNSFFRYEGLKPVSYTHLEYILSCVLEKQIVNTGGIKELLPELKRIGNNLNQIAKRCNEGGMLPLSLIHI